MKFSISNKDSPSSGHLIIPFDKEHIEELLQIQLNGLPTQKIVKLLESSLPKPGNKTILIDDLTVHLVSLESDACYGQIKKAFTQIGMDASNDDTHVICSHRSYEPIQLKAIINGLSVSNYNINLYQTKNKKELNNTHYIIHTKDAVDKPEQIILASTILSDAQKMVMDIVNAPANKLIPDQLAQLVAEKLKNTNVTVKILDQDQIIKENLHTVLAVNRGSEDPARFVIMEYRAPKADQKTPHFGLVGKGITFDTGGISLKKPQNMHYMKCDLGGGAAVFGAMYMIGLEKPNAHVTAIVPITENSIGTKAIKPGDVIDSHSGKTIEIIDTDAEGRLILADGLSYMLQNYKPDHLIDLATLTGSIVQTLGYQSGGIFTNNDQLSDAMCGAGEEVGERLWRMPIWDSYKKDISSEVADVRNYSGRPVAGSISAAKFLEAFTEEHPSWAHLDIAGVAFGENPYTTEKAGTGYGPHLISQWIFNSIKISN